MFQFQHINHLYALAILPVLVILFIVSLLWRKKKLQKLGNEELVGEQLRGFIPGRSTFKFILLATGLTSVIIGWANLQAGDKVEKVERKGVDVIVALDVSKSMLAKDIQPDRLTRAKQLIMRLADKMGNDRMALIVFAGRAYLQVPLTTDFSVIKMMLQNVNPDMVPAQGTVIGDAIEMGIQSFSQNERKYKSLIVISDGEDHDEKAEQKAREAAEAGIIVHTVGIGSPQGATLYDPDTRSVKLDENGNPVISKLNEDELRSIAIAGHGTYNLLQNTDEVADKLNNSLLGMEQKNLGSVVFTDFTSYFQYFLLVGLIALVIEWILPGSRKKLKVGGAAVLLITVPLMLAGNRSYAQANKYLKEGNRLYDQQKYKEAIADYSKALAKDPNNTPGLFNLGNSLYQQKQYDSSRKVLAATEKLMKDKNGKAATEYNIGNSFMSQQKWEDAVSAYKQTLRNNPQDVDAKYNLSYAEEMLKKQQQQQQKQQKQNKQDQKQDKSKQQQQGNDKQDNKQKEQQDQQQQQQQQQQQKEEQQQQAQSSKLSQQQADQLLNALEQEERKLQDKMKKEKGVPSRMEKDW